MNHSFKIIHIYTSISISHRYFNKQLIINEVLKVSTYINVTQQFKQTAELKLGF